MRTFIGYSPIGLSGPYLTLWSSAAFFLISIVATNIIKVTFPRDESRSIKKENTKKFRGLEPRQIIPPETPGIGVCRIDPKDLPPKALPLSPARIIHSERISEGTAVGIVGFPQGLSLPISFDSRSHLQLTPLLQIGIISGILPFSGIPKPDSFVLDLFVNPGSSGSPLFLSDGNVIGVVYATRRRFAPLCVADQSGEVSESKNCGVFIPSGLGLAIPSARFPKEWLRREKSNTV